MPPNGTSGLSASAARSGRSGAGAPINELKSQLPERKAAQLRFEFETEMARLDAA